MVTKKIRNGICLLLLILPLNNRLFAQTPVTNQRLYDTIPFLPDYWPQRVAQFDNEPIVTGRIIFLGNSITQMGNWQKLLNDSTVINRGIGGDITFGVLKRLEDVIRRKPSKLFVLIGINDIGKDIPDVVIADNVRKIIERVQSGSATTRIFLHSILPVNNEVPNFPQHYDKNDHVLATNNLLKEVANRAHVRWLDIHAIFRDKNGKLGREFTGDGLHLNGKGYELWVNYMKENGCF